MSVGIGGRLKQIEIRLRTNAPRFVRQADRLGRAVLSEHPGSRALPSSLVDGCEVCASRHILVAKLAKGGIGAELGTQTGAFAAHLLKAAEPAELHVIDIDYSQFDSTLLGGRCLRRHQGLTHEVMQTFPDAHFDWIYIDADHSYEGVLRDARTSRNKLKPGGMMIFNDFAHVDNEFGRYGVHRAVVDFALETQWRLRYLALEPSALYDVALVKPDN